MSLFSFVRPPCLVVMMGTFSMADPFSSSISSGPRTQKDAKSNTKTPLDPKNIQDTYA